MGIDILSTLAIAVGLAMDAFSVSIAGGATLKKNIIKTAFLAGGMFGFFQFAMPVLGWLVGAPIAGFLSSVGSWIVVALFFFIGGKMVYDGFKGDENVNLTGLKTLLILAVATSIDALAVGISYGLEGTAILLPSIIIGVVAFIFSFGGVFFGSKLSSVLGTKMEIIGGIILILIGVKFLVETILTIV